MSYEVKFGYKPGYRMVFTAFQPDGDGRGISEQPLLEVRNTGYYAATPLTDLQSEDFVIVYNFEDCEWEDETVVSEDEPAQLVDDDGVPLHYEGDWVVDYDTLETQILASVEEVLGSGEYTTIVDDVATLVQQGGTVTNIYDESTTGVGGSQSLTGLGNIVTHDGGDC